MRTRPSLSPRHSGSWILGLALAGCVPHGYRPAAPHRAAALGLTADVTQLDTLSRADAVTVSVRIQGGPDTRLVRVLLTPAASQPCREGVRAARLVVDGESRWLRPASVAGAHDLALAFARGAAFTLLQASTALDFVLDTAAGERCVRVALTGPEPALAWQTEVSGTASASIRAYGPVTSVAGVASGWAFSDDVGALLGPVRLQAEFGFGTANCTRACAGSSGGFLWAPLGVTAHTELFDRDGFAVDLGVGYRWFFGFVNSKAAERTVRLDAPELSLRFAGTVNQGPGLPGGARIGSAGLELFASDWRYSGSLGNESSFVLGAGFVWDHGF